jgi:hypothetical protein
MDSTNSLSTCENRARLARDTAAYYESLTLEAVEEENSLAESLARAAAKIDFEREP